MPELPDVETFRRRLDRQAVGRRIAETRVFDERLLDGVTKQQLSRALAGHRVISARRHGKHLFAELDDGTLLVLHFGMTGELVPLEKGADAPRYTVLHLVLDDGSGIAVTSRRRLGRIGLAESAAQFVRSQTLGTDALDPALDAASFQAALGSPRGALKSALMDQSKLAGIGNIYSDEILFQARLHPNRRVGELSREDVERLFKSARNVLGEAIKRGVLSEGREGALPKEWLLTHREKGGSCPRCGKVLRTMKVGGRTAYFCASCQPA